MPLSVVINTKNVAATLERTLQSVEFADEIIIVDMQSRDETLEIAREYTDQILDFTDVGFVEPARNFAISQASHEWILVVDADEEIGPKLRQVITNIVQEKNQDSLPDCFYLPRKNIIFGKWIKKTGWWPDHVLRLFRKNYVEWSDEIHSIPITKGEVKELPAQEDLAIIHHNYQSVDQFISRLNRYTSIQAEQRLATTAQQQITADEVLKRFNNEFLRRLFAQHGIDEGVHGTSLSLLQGMSEAVMMMKVWEEQGFPEVATNQSKLQQSLRQSIKELNYWLANWQVGHTSGLTQLYWRVRRKLMR